MSVRDWFEKHLLFLDEATPVSADDPLPVAIAAVEGGVTVNLTGDISVDTLGALDDAKVTNPDAASATLPALARGQLKQLVDILAKLSADPATQTTLAAVLAKLSADPATETTLATLATQATLADVLTALADPATETTLAAVLAKLSADPATETTLATLATQATLADVLTALADPATETTLATLATDAKIDALIALVGAADDDAGDNTLMGQLKQIALNTTPP